MKHVSGTKRAALALCIGLACGLTAPAAFAATVSDGFDLGVTYTQDGFRNVHGGYRQGNAAPGAINLSAAIDGRAWGGSENDKLYFDYLGTLGSSISDDVGDLQGLDNIEAYNTTKLYSAWYQHDFGASGFMTRIGLQDWNASFDNLDAAGVLINSSFGLDAVTAISNVSQYPTTAFGAIVRYNADNGAYVMGGVFDGVPGLPGHPEGTHVEFRSGDGTFSSLEAGIESGGDRPWKLAAGAWYQTADYTDPAGRARDRDHGVYVLGQKRLLGGATTPKLDVFAQFGDAPDGRNPLHRYAGAGITVTGLFAARPDDVLSVGVARAEVSSSFREAAPGSRHAETVYEATWQAPIGKHVSIQPDVQYIVHPGADAGLDNALVVGVRAQLAW